MNPYEILNIPTDASADEIKKAYRDKSKEVHPDRCGNNEDFVEVNNCFLILSDPTRRKKYDETGSTEPEISFEKEFAGFIQSTFIPFIQNKDVNKVDLITEFKKYVFITEREMNKNIEAEEKTLERLKNARNRLKTKGNNAIHGVIDLQINQCNMNINQYHQNIGFIHQCQVAIEDYTYSFDEPTQETPQEFQRISLITQNH